MKKTDRTYIFDFDKTIVSVESLEILADICLDQHSQKEFLMKKISKTTEKGMEGEISFSESLRTRFNLLSPTENDIELCAREIRKHITKSILDNKSFFEENAESIYIVSGGFTKLIFPTTRMLGISDNHIFANSIVGGALDTSNPLVLTGGKIEVVRRLKKNNVIMIGDGYTDLQVRQMGAADCFVAFMEHVRRVEVMRHADRVVNSFNEFLLLDEIF